MFYLAVFSLASLFGFTSRIKNNLERGFFLRKSLEHQDYAHIYCEKKKHACDSCNLRVLFNYAKSKLLKSTMAIFLLLRLADGCVCKSKISTASSHYVIK